MKLSIVIPVYNEEKTLSELLKKVESVDLGKIEKEIILVDDCSKDKSRDILKKLEKKYKVYYHEKNSGKGAAIRTGLSHATGDIIIIQDADLEYDPNDYEKLIKPILEGKTSVVYGSRLLHRPEMMDIHYLGNKFLSFMTSLLYHNKITDMETCYKVFKCEVIKGMKLRARRFDFEPEITAKILRRKYKILEIPISFKPRGFEEGKKITWRDGVKALFYLVKYRFFD